MPQHYMQHALRLAEKGRYTCSPNPMVGCVIVRDDHIIAEGWHQMAGQAHAEINALNNCSTDLSNAAMYVTLEPCCYQGRTAPCVNAIVQSGLKHVYVACLDPNPLVAGLGVKQLRQAGITVEIGLAEEAAKQLNRDFFHYITQQKPYVIAKWAMSIDGKLATAKGDSKWISNAKSRQVVHQLRRQVDAIVIGANTAIKDDPQLTVRLTDVDLTAEQQPARIVLDGKTPLPRNLKLFSAELNNGTYLASELLQQDNYQLSDLLTKLATMEMKNILVEGGANTLSRFFAEELIEEIHCFIAPIVIGGGATPFNQTGVDTISHAEKFRLITSQRIDDDLYCTYQKKVKNV